MAPEYRLAKRPTLDQSGSSATSKRLKTTGDDFKLRELKLNDSCQTNDEVHKSISLCPVIKVIVDTQVFQRLRDIAQLGTSEYLYSCANHNRFQHSLGVAHLAERMCKNIKEEQPSLGTSHKDVLCVKLAGLLHDIGHGPWSHIYEAFRDDDLPSFLEAHPELKKQYRDCDPLGKVPEHWSHEQSSLMMLDAVLAELGLKIDLKNLDQPLQQIGDGIAASSMRVWKPPFVEDSVLTSRDFVFVKECILGKPLPEVQDELHLGAFIGRTQPEKEWLYDIVNNRHSGLDVDKIDYYARDQGRTTGAVEIDNKLIEDARVAKASCINPSECQKCRGNPSNAAMHFVICYPKKRVEPAMGFFKERLKLHQRIYQNKKTVAVQCLLVDILCSADPFLRLESYRGERFPISRAILKTDFLVRLNDQVLKLIEHSTQDELEVARRLCRRYRKHDFYKCAVEEKFNFESDRNELDAEDIEDLDDKEKQAVIKSRSDKEIWKMTEEQIQKSILQEKELWDEALPQSSERDSLEAKDFIVKKYYMHHGSKEKNPLLQMRFFDHMNEKLFGSLDDLPEAKLIEESECEGFIPKSFQIAGVRVFCRDESKREIVSLLFKQWYVVRMQAAIAAPMQSQGEIDIEMGSDDENVSDEEQQQQQQPRFLSQDDEQDDDDFRNLHDSPSMDQSPIPVHRRR